MSNFSHAYNFPTTSSKYESPSGPSLSPFSEDDEKPTSRQILDQLTGMVDAAEEGITYKNSPSSAAAALSIGNHLRHNQNFQNNINTLNTFNYLNSNNSPNINNNNNQTPIFNGRHAIWAYFDVTQTIPGTYFCRASSECQSAYSWPPSTTVAGRHLRDRHPEVYYKAMGEETNRKRSDTFLNQQKNSGSGSSSLSRKRAHQQQSIYNQQVNNSFENSFSATLAASFASITDTDQDLLNQKPRENKIIKLEDFEFPTDTSSKDIYQLEKTSSTIRSSMWESSSSNSEKKFCKRIFLKDSGNNGKNLAPINQSKNSLEMNEKAIDLKTEIYLLKEQEQFLRIKFQKTNEQLLDSQKELDNLKLRNEQLEKKQKSFNCEIKIVRDQLTEILEQKERIEKQYFEQNIALSRYTTEILNLKEENSDLRKNLKKVRQDLDEINEIQKGTGTSTEDNVGNIKQKNNELTLKTTEFENELNDNVQKSTLIEQNVSRLEINSERIRIETQRDNDFKDNEIADIRAQYQRRLNAYEDQINDLSDANNSLIKQNRILENRVRQFASQSRASSFDGENGFSNSNREMRKMLALLKDTQILLNHEREKVPKQSLIRQLKEQLEDSEIAKIGALKGRYTLESELADLRQQLDAALTTKNFTEERILTIIKEKNSTLTLAQEHDEQLQKFQKKYKAQLQQANIDAIQLADQIEQIGNLERAKQRLQEQLNEMASSIEYNKLNTVEKHKIQLLELKFRDLQSRLDLEISIKLRLESIVIKLREEVESLQTQIIDIKNAKKREYENSRKFKREIQLLQEQVCELKKSETELLQRGKNAKMNYEELIEKHNTTLTELKIATQRAEDLKAVLKEDIIIEEENEEAGEDLGSSSGRITGLRDSDEYSRNNKDNPQTLFPSLDDSTNLLECNGAIN